MEKENFTLNKIEFDESSLEPKIVSAPKEDFLPAKEEVKIEEPTKSQGEQLIMSKIIGFDKTSSINKRQKIWKNSVTAVFIVLVLGVLCFTAYHDFFSKEPPSIRYMLSIMKANWYYFLLAITALCFCYLLKGTKLSIMCKSLTGKWHYKTCFETGIVGHYYNNVTPFAVGGQPFEIYHLSRNGVDGGTSASLPLTSFFMQQLAFFVMGLFAIIAYGTNAFNLPKEIIGVMPTVITIIATVGLVCAFFMPTIVMIFSVFPKLGKGLVGFVFSLGNKLKLVKEPEKTKGKVMKTVENNSRCIKQLTKKPTVFILTFLLSIGEQLALCSIAYFTLRSFGFDWEAHNIREWAQVVQLCMILYAAISFIPTPGNAGAADLSFYLLFDTGLMIGANKIGGLAFPSMMIWRLLSFYSFIIIGFVFTTLYRKKHKS